MIDIETGRYWDKPWALVQGCTPVSPACLHCWCAAEAHMRQRHPNPKIREQYEGLTTLTNGIPTFNGTIRIREDRLDIPLRTRKPTVFAIWSDLFLEKVPFNFIDKAVVVMTGAVNHTFLVLTKRPERLVQYFSAFAPGYTPNNIYWGTTIENNEQADRRIPELLKVPGKKFLSVEPMLGPVDLLPFLAYKDGSNIISQVICGGETGRNARPVHPNWVRRLRDQCIAAGVPFFFKSFSGRKKDRLLDGRTHDELAWM